MAIDRGDIMPTLPSEFQDLADELIDDEFTAFKGVFSCERQGAFNSTTETYEAGPAFTIGAIESNLEDSQFQNQLIRVGDFNLVINPRTPTASGVYFEPRVGDKMTYNGKQIQIVSSKPAGTANAVFKPACRYL